MIRIEQEQARSNLNLFDDNSVMKIIAYFLDFKNSKDLKKFNFFKFCHRRDLNLDSVSNTNALQGIELLPYYFM